jgi:hypothetical protein
MDTLDKNNTFVASQSGAKSKPEKGKSKSGRGKLDKNNTFLIKQGHRQK